MTTFRIDVRDAYYLLLDAPNRKMANDWKRGIPEPRENITMRIASQDERLDYVIAGFEVRIFSIPFLCE